MSGGAPIRPRPGEEPSTARPADSTRLDHCPWPEVAALRSRLLLVPLGSCEQHGPHLPPDTDTRIAAAVAEGHGGETDRDDATLVAPAINYGASGEHQDFPGTVSIGTEALRVLLVEYGRSACHWAGRLVFVNGHGGNLPALADAVRLLRAEGRDVAWFPCAEPGTDAHAGYHETSLMLAIAPETVHLHQVAPGNTTPLPRLLPALRANGVRAAAPTGVLGDPTGACVQHGTDSLARQRHRLRVATRRWAIEDSGRLT